MHLTSLHNKHIRLDRSANKGVLCQIWNSRWVGRSRCCSATANRCWTFCLRIFFKIFYSKNHLKSQTFVLHILSSTGGRRERKWLAVIKQQCLWPILLHQLFLDRISVFGRQARKEHNVCYVQLQLTHHCMSISSKISASVSAMQMAIDKILCGSTNYHPLVPSTLSLHTNRSVP